MAEADSARVEAINSLTPYGANDFLLSQLGQIYLGPGSAPASPTNTSVEVVFIAVDASSNPLAGQVIPVGFTVSDGTYQYVVQDGGVTGSDGQTPPLFCLATIAGSWAVPTNSVTELVTQPPPGVTLTFTNPAAGVSGVSAETAESYRARVVQAGQAVGTGIPTLLKTLLFNVSGVQQRLVSVRQQGGEWEIIVGGGDPYQVADAIYESGINIAILTGSVLAITNITQANPGVVTTALNHGLTNGDQETLSEIVGMVPLNGALVTVTVIDEKSFSIGVNTLGYPAYVSGGVVTPNPRNVEVSLNDYPDIYTFPIVNPPQQTVAVAATYNTTAPNFVSQAAVAQLAAPAIAAYVNSITVGAPINLLVLEAAFLTAIASVLPADQVSTLSFAIDINGISTDPEPGTNLVVGDVESYFQTSTGSISVTQG